MRALSSSEKRTIKVLLIVLVPLLFFTQVFKPFQSKLREVQSQAQAERAALIRDRNAVETADRNPGLQLATDSAYRAIEPRLFEGRDDAIATSEVTNYIKEVAFKNSVYVLPETRGGNASLLTAGVRSLRVELRAESDLEGLLGMLRALENGDKLISVERMDLTKSSRSSRVAAGAAAATADSVERLSMTATLVGYALGDLTSTTTGRAAAAARAGRGTP